MTYCLYSLAGVKEDDDRDLIDEAIADTYTYKAKVSSQLWARYRYALINACDLDRWVQRVTDRVTNLHNRYSVLFSAYDELQDSIASLDSTETETETRDLSTTNTQTGTNDATVTTKQTATAEDLPATSGSSASSWLSTRDITDASQTTDADSTVNGSGTDKGTITHERTTHSGMIPAELYRKMKDSLYDPYYEYTSEFYDLFIPYFATECCL